MKLTDDEILELRDVIGNASLALKHIHALIDEEVDRTVLQEAIRHAIHIQNTCSRVLAARLPMSTLIRRAKQ